MNKYQSDVEAVEQAIRKRTGKKAESVYFLVANLSAELGELCDEIIGIEGERIEDPRYRDVGETSKEMVDVIFNVLRIANHYKIDLSKHWDKRIKQLKRKFSGGVPELA